MNRLEFNEVLKVMGINNPLVTTSGRYGTSEDVHFWKDLAIYFGGSYYSVIRGKIPLEVANIISNKYPDNKYDIRVSGGGREWTPEKWAADDIYKEEIRRYLDEYSYSEEYKKKCEESRLNMLARPSEGKYIETYHIDTREGLIILLSEMKDYYLRNQGLSETEVARYNEIMGLVTKNILKKVNPSITTYEWMEADSECKDVFNDTILKSEDSVLDKSIREILDKFDRTINPYINGEIELDDIEDYLQRVTIYADSYDREDNKYRKGCARVFIKPKDGADEVKYFRGVNGFSYQLIRKINEDEYMMVVHYFSNTGEKESEKGEHIYIAHYGDNSKKNIDLRYNLTMGLTGETYKDKCPVTLEQKQYIYDELVKAVDIASTITIDNMIKKGKEKRIDN